MDRLEQSSHHGGVRLHLRLAPSQNFSWNACESARSRCPLEYSRRALPARTRRSSAIRRVAGTASRLERGCGSRCWYARNGPSRPHHDRAVKAKRWPLVGELRSRAPKTWNVSQPAPREPRSWNRVLRSERAVMLVRSVQRCRIARGGGWQRSRSPIGPFRVPIEAFAMADPGVHDPRSRHPGRLAVERSGTPIRVFTIGRCAQLRGDRPKMVWLEVGRSSTSSIERPHHRTPPAIESSFRDLEASPFIVRRDAVCPLQTDDPETRPVAAKSHRAAFGRRAAFAASRRPA